MGSIGAALQLNKDRLRRTSTLASYDRFNQRSACLNFYTLSRHGRDACLRASAPAVQYARPAARSHTSSADTSADPSKAAPESPLAPQVCGLVLQTMDSGLIQRIDQAGPSSEDSPVVTILKPESYCSHQCRFFMPSPAPLFRKGKRRDEVLSVSSSHTEVNAAAPSGH